MTPDHLCPFCDGSGREFSPADGAVPCLLCDGSGYATLMGDLGATHSQKRRPFFYAPATRTLRIGTGKRAASYTVAEFRPAAGFEGRAFAIHKHDGSGHYACLVAADRASCDCAGKTYLNTDKANLRSYLRDDREFASAGCKHLDALRLLLDGAWLDLPEHVPESD